VKKDVEQMNNMLNEELKGKGIKYVFAVTVDKFNQNRQKKKQKTISAM
jgi:hypothetical protein